MAVLCHPHQRRDGGGGRGVNVAEPSDEQAECRRSRVWSCGEALRKAPPCRSASPRYGHCSMELSLQDGTYAFRMVRGPEYRVCKWNLYVREDKRRFAFGFAAPRTVRMIDEGWTSGDILRQKTACRCGWPRKICTSRRSWDTWNSIPYRGPR